VRLLFASGEWFEALHAELLRVVDDLPADRGFSFGERFVNGGDPALGWHLRWQPGVLDFVAQPADDVDAELVVDLDVAHRLCAPLTEELRDLQRAALKDGRIVWRGDPSSLPAALGAVHERMGAVTEPFRSDMQM
jgi:hypothetical protein